MYNLHLLLEPVNTILTFFMKVRHTVDDNCYIIPMVSASKALQVQSTQSNLDRGWFPCRVPLRRNVASLASHSVGNLA